MDASWPKHRATCCTYAASFMRDQAQTCQRYRKRLAATLSGLGAACAVIRWTHVGVAFLCTVNSIDASDPKTRTTFVTTCPCMSNAGEDECILDLCPITRACWRECLCDGGCAHY